MKNSSFQKETVTPKAESDLSDLDLARKSLIKKLNEKAKVEMALNLTQSANNPEIPFQVQAWLNKIHRALPIDYLVSEMHFIQNEIESLIELIDELKKSDNLAETKK